MLRRIVVLVVTAATLVAMPAAEAAGQDRLHFAAWPSGDFGNVLVGERQTKKFFVSNSSDRATGRLRVSVSGSDTFTVPRAKNRCSGRNLRPGDRCRVTVRFTPAFVQGPAPFYILSGDADGSLEVTGKRRPHQSATRRLSGGAETPAMRTARPVCESAPVNGTLTRGQPMSSWNCVWPYIDESDYLWKLNALTGVCQLSGAIGLAGGVENGVVYSTCTSQGA